MQLLALYLEGPNPVVKINPKTSWTGWFSSYNPLPRDAAALFPDLVLNSEKKSGSGDFSYLWTPLSEKVPFIEVPQK